MGFAAAAGARKAFAAQNTNSATSIISFPVGPGTLNGAPFNGDPGTIPLEPYAVIQLDVGAPAIAAQPYTWPPGY